MASLTVPKVKIVGLSACVPRRVEENLDLPLWESPDDARKVIDSTGIERRRVVEPGTTASDLAVEAVTPLLNDLGWEKESIDLLVYVCASRDYIAPQTACILQARLGLSEGCFAFDLPMGCAGWVQGLASASSLLSHGGLKRCLLINAETNTLNRSKKDKSVRPLFGDAAAVTALEYDPECDHPFEFVFGVDGTGAEAVMAKYGGTRCPTTPEAVQEKEYAPGIVRKGTDMVVNGMDVFSFAIRRPPQSLRELISLYDIDIEKIDWLFLHQANRFIDEKIRRSLKVPAEKVPYSLDDFGNVSGVSIPLTMVTRCANALIEKDNHCLGCGFGVGLAWASVRFWVNRIVCVPLVEY